MTEVPEIEGLSTLAEPTDGPPLPAGESFLDEAHPGPAPTCPEVLGGDEKPSTPTAVLAKAVIDAQRSNDLVLEDTIRIHETRTIKGGVIDVSVETAAGPLSLTTNVCTAFTEMLHVAAEIARRLDEEWGDKMDCQERSDITDAWEHARAIRKALNLPRFAVGQVWRTVCGDEFTVTRISDSSVYVRYSDEADDEYPRIGPQYDADGAYVDGWSGLPEPRMILEMVPIVLVKAAPTSPTPAKE